MSKAAVTTTTTASAATPGPSPKSRVQTGAPDCFSGDLFTLRIATTFPVEASDPGCLKQVRRRAREVSLEGSLRDSDAMWASFNGHGTHRIYVTRLGPFSLALLALGIGLIAGLVLVLLIGTFLIWISLVALLATATILSALLRQSLRRWL